MGYSAGRAAMSLAYEIVTGKTIAPCIEAVAELRIRVFADWPYLYAGNVEYERDYLAHYLDSPWSIFVLARDDNGRIVGCSTGLPLAHAHEDFQQPLRQAGYGVGGVFYFGESVLDPAWRGRGAGHAFFDHREAHAKRLGHEMAAFCAVLRPNDHPQRPPAYRPLDEFWIKRGYAPMAGITAHFAWQDIDEDGESEKPLQFWAKRL
jgi:GNAT superfamily N-acetyltransferase